MSEERATYIAPQSNEQPQLTSARAVQVILSLDWAQAVTRLQQLDNEGCNAMRLLHDDLGRVRIEPYD